MEELDEEQRLIRRYLMGEPGSERERVEKRMLTDPAYFERVLMAEDELFDDFVFGDMSAAEREEFTKHLLSTPRQQQKLEITKALKEHSETARPLGLEWILAFTSEHKLGAGLAFAALLLVGLFAGYKALTYDPLERELARLNSSNAMIGQTGRPNYTVTLLPTLFRGQGAAGDDEKQLTIPPGVEVALFYLALTDDDHESYNVTLMRPTEAKPLRVEGLKAASVEGAQVLPVKIPSRLLVAGRHELTLSGVAADGHTDENIRRYPFRVVDAKR
jgi:hypothetical protein